jgi:long-chain acyl-CoA synthetase
MFVVSTNPDLNADHVIAFCKENMAGYKVPKFVEFRDELPMTNVGKVLRKDLKAQEKAKARASDRAGETTEEDAA